MLTEKQKEHKKKWRKEYQKDPKVKEMIRITRRKYESSPKFKLKKKDFRIKLKYGITLEESNKQILLQNNRCAICSINFNKINKLHIHHDHCHKTGKFRGILCNRCNGGLGKFNDNIILLNSAIKYLEKSK